MPGTVREPPPISQVSLPVVRGITPPAVPDYDLLSLARDGIHPFVSPAADPRLASLQVPLVTRHDSFESAVAASRGDGRFPPPEEVRTEEFLAALALPPGEAGGEQLGIGASGGPSPWSEERRHLLVISVWSDDRRPPRADLAAEDAELHVVFDPAAIRRYRLLGHEADVGGGMLPAEARTRLYVGDAASILFEIELEPQAIGQLATAELSWRLPNTGTLQKTRRGIHRSQIVATFVEATPSFQLATVAAATAELLRRSPHLRNRFTSRDVLTMTDAVHPTIDAHPRLDDLLDILETIGE
jgi:hypothetical protein